MRNKKIATRFLNLITKSFVENILRDVVIALRGVENISAFAVECENFESIHNHNAFAAYEEC